jgi:hypothetical protein
MIPSRFLSAIFVFACIGAANTSQAQSKFHGADIGVAATGQFTTSITSQDFATNGSALPHQWTTESPGVLITVRDRPVPWAGMELNYQYTKFDENFFTSGPISIPTNVHELSAAYLFHMHMHKLAPYIGVGGGGLDFVPASGITSQWRGTGLVDLGLDVPTHSKWGYRIGARDLLYRAPNFYNAGLASSRWVSTEEPYGGVYIKF